MDNSFVDVDGGAVTRRPAYVKAAIASAAQSMAAESSDAEKAVYKVLLELAPTWDADQRWAAAWEIVSAVRSVSASDAKPDSAER